jgi:hypothetical protein
VRPAVLGLVVALALTGCGPDESEPPTPSYTPVADARLFAEVGDLPGVISEDLRWVDKFGDSNRYGGYVYVRRKADQCRVLDEAFAILRKGRPGASIFVGVLVGPPSPSQGEGFTMALADLDLIADPTKRYGEQPDTGRPPDDQLCKGS